MRLATKLILSLLLGLIAVVPEQEVGWTANGRDVHGTRYLPASEITRENVGRLEVAWTYRTGEADPRFATKKPASFEATPLVVDGTMYVGTPLGRVIALDPATGRERWVFDPQIERDVTYGDFATRGVSTWLDDVGRSGHAVPPPHLRRDGAVAALCARRARRARCARTSATAASSISRPASAFRRSSRRRTR